MSREEESIVHALCDLCQDYQVKSLIQVGACDGYEAAKIRDATSCQITCIDADPKSTPLSRDIEFYELLIGATDCVTSFYVSNSLGLSSQIPRGDNGEEKVEMQQYRLDSFCTLHGISPDALIIDTEGTTLDVLDGCGQILDGVRLIYAECQTSMIRPGMRLLPEVDEFLAIRGFTQYQGGPTYNAGSQGNYTWVKP